jgi:branched-chain amino acid transport system substrate-binding protein
MNRCNFIATLTLSALCGGAAAQGTTPGVTRTEIRLGTIQDLSGPLASFGKHIRNGMQMRVDELNELGGVHGRRIKLEVEDSAYDPKKAVLAAQKMVTQGERIFAMVGHLGTAHNMAAMPVQLERSVINFFPVSAGREMYEPAHPLKWANQATYYDQMRIAAPRLAKERNLKKVCTLYQDDEAGLEAVRGAEAGLKVIGMDLAEKTSYKRGATDFTSQVARMKAAGCELVVLATAVRETVGAMAEARKTGFAPLFVGPVGVYGDLVPRLGGKAVDGLYATMTAQQPYVDEGEQSVRFWAKKFKTQFNEEPTMQSVVGYSIVDAFIKVAFKAGPSLTTDSFVKTMEGMTFNRDMFGNPEMTFSPSRHLGNRFSRLSQLQDGRWRVVSDYVAFSGLKTVMTKEGRFTVESEFFKDF